MAAVQKLLTSGILLLLDLVALKASECFNMRSDAVGAYDPENTELSFFSDSDIL